MRVRIKVHAGFSQEKIEKVSDEKYEIWIKEKPIDGKANQRLLKFLKKFFKKDIKIVSGLSSKNKLIEVL